MKGRQRRGLDAGGRDSIKEVVLGDGTVEHLGYVDGRLNVPDFECDRCGGGKTKEGKVTGGHMPCPVPGLGNDGWIIQTFACSCMAGALSGYPPVDHSVGIPHWLTKGQYVLLSLYRQKEHKSYTDIADAIPTVQELKDRVASGRGLMAKAFNAAIERRPDLAWISIPEIRERCYEADRTRRFG